MSDENNLKKHNSNYNNKNINSKKVAETSGNEEFIPNFYNSTNNNNNNYFGQQISTQKHINQQQ
jgi:hypothetical protein